MSDAVSTLVGRTATRVPRWLPERAVWAVHAPVLMALVALLRPRRILEVGTVDGLAVAAAAEVAGWVGLETEVLAVGAWRRSGDGGAAAFDALRSHLATFALPAPRLLDLPLDAAGEIPGSFELVLVDGDSIPLGPALDPWIAKLAPGGVLLLHGTRLSEQASAVPGMWASLRASPSLEFPGGRGLGMVAPQGIPDALVPILGGEGAAAVELSAALGQRLALEQRCRRRESQIQDLRAKLRGQEGVLARLHAALLGIQGSAAWQGIAAYRRLRDRLLGRGRVRRAFDGVLGLVKRALGLRVRRGRSGADPYAAWIARWERPPDPREARRAVERLGERPLFALVVSPADGQDETPRLVESLRAQVYPRWELWISASPASGDGARYLATAELDPRVRVGAPPQGVAGDWIGQAELGASLPPHALLDLARRVEEEPALDVLYTDEDLLSAGGQRRDPFFKPDWSPDLLLSTPYLGRLTFLRSALVAELGARLGQGAAGEWRTVLLATERARRIGHLAQVLYHGPARPAAAAGEARAALEEAMRRRGFDAAVEEIAPDAFRLRRAIRGKPRVTIVVPTRDRVDLLERCVRSIEERSTWRRFEVVVVDNGSTDRATLRYLESLATGHRVLRYDLPFNWAAINNSAAARSDADHLLFLNNDVEVIAPDWLEALLEHAQRPEVGAVGAKLLYPDGTVQHAGVVIGIGGVAGHAFKRLPAGDAGPGGLAAVVRNVSAVTGACMMVRRAVFEEVGGFDERFRVAFNDVDFCLRLRERGYLVVQTPHALLYHYESATRGARHPPEDEALMRERWGPVLYCDPYYNPNLTLEREDWGLPVSDSPTSPPR